MEYVIYKITNKITQKSYVGKTNDLQTRLKGHQHSKCCRYLYNAIKKYGWDNFEVEVLHKCTREEASLLELEYILRENTLFPNGYNLVLETDQGRVFSSEMKESMSKNIQGSYQSNKPKTSKYIGVRQSKGRSSFDTRLVKNDITYSKSFKNEIEAAEAYDKIALYLYGPEAKINFPEKKEEYLKTNLAEFFVWFQTRKKLSSNYEGVCYHKVTKKWYAYYYQNKKQIRLGLFNTEQEAINKRKEYNESIKQN